MSKKPRRSRHRVPTLGLRSEPVSERYQREVNYATTRLERRYRRAVAARDKAIERLTQAQRANAKHSRLAELRRQVEIREYELVEIQKLMQPGNRSKVAWRPIPIQNPGGPR